jgi:predicted outer membrane protein
MQSAMTSERTTGGTTLLVLALVATLVSLMLPIYWFDGNRSVAYARAGFQDDNKGTWKNKYGPVTSLDREFLRAVRAASLSELPAGQAAKSQGSSKTVRTLGKQLVDGYTDLDKQILKTGRTIGLSLPSKPTGPQKQYVDEVKQAKGKKFDKLLVNHVRKESGATLAFVSLVRDQTRNSRVRALATKANTVCLDHLAAVEDTGLIDYGSLPNPK